MVYKYVWARGSQHKTSAQFAGEECARLAEESELTPGNLVDASRPEDAPLHSEFEWNDNIAAERYREDQARYIIRSIVTIECDDKPMPEVRSFVSVPVRDEDAEEVKRHYVGTCVALKDVGTREMVLNDAMRDLQSFRRKYSTLKELSGVFAAIDAFEIDIKDS